MISVLVPLLYLSASEQQLGPDSGLRKTTTCYLSESKRLSRTSLSEREIASRVVELCKEEIDLASAELFPTSEVARQKLIVSVKDQVITEVQTLRSSRTTKQR